MLTLALPVMDPEAVAVRLLRMVMSDALTHAVPLPVSVRGVAEVPNVMLPALMVDKLPNDKLLAKISTPLVTLSVPIAAVLLPERVTMPSPIFLRVPPVANVVLPDSVMLRPEETFNVAVLLVATFKLPAMLELLLVTSRLALLVMLMAFGRPVTFCNSNTPLSVLS